MNLEDFFSNSSVLNFNEDAEETTKETFKTQDENTTYKKQEKTEITKQSINVTTLISNIDSECSCNELESDNTGNVVMCKKCGRVLKGFESKSIGYGPTCYKRIQADKCKQINLFSSSVDRGIKNG